MDFRECICVEDSGLQPDYRNEVKVAIIKPQPSRDQIRVSGEYQEVRPPSRCSAYINKAQENLSIRKTTTLDLVG